MIVTELFEIDGISYTRTYSDRGMMIHGGEPEDDYISVEEPTAFGRTYTETSIPIPDDDISDDEVLEIMFGGTE